MNIFTLLSIGCVILTIIMLVNAIWICPRLSDQFVIKTVIFSNSKYASSTSFSGIVPYYQIETIDGNIYTIGTPKIADIDSFEKEVMPKDVITVGFRKKHIKKTEICVLSKGDKIYLSYEDYCNYYSPSKSYSLALLFAVLSVIGWSFSRLFA